VRAVTYRDIARRIARAETEGQRAQAAALLAWYREVGAESTAERMVILREELKVALEVDRIRQPLV
jgi:hypothetical protein